MKSKFLKNQNAKIKFFSRTLLSFCALFLTISMSFAQLKGSGKIVTKNYDYKNFSQLSFQDLDGKIEVEVGKYFNISVEIDDNLLPLLSFDKNNSENELKIFFKNNVNNSKYIEDCHLKIKITLPKLTQVKHQGNSSLIVLNLNESTLKIENTGNGTSKISGFVENLEILNKGNGSTLAKELTAKNAEINCSGNGSVSVNVSNELTGKATGNSNIINYGRAKFDSKSSKYGNAELINRLK
jgi:hypothetical protein